MEKLAFSIGIASSFNDRSLGFNKSGPLPVYDDRRSDAPFFSLARLASTIVLSSFVFVVSADQATTAHPFAPSSKLTPSPFRSSRVNSVGESGPASVSCCGVARECEIFQDRMRVYERDRERERDEMTRREREGRSKRDLTISGGERNNTD